MDFVPQSAQNLMLAPANFVRFPNLKLKIPRIPTPSSTLVFSGLFFSYFLVISGIVYDIIMEPPGIGATQDPVTGQNKPQAFLPVRMCDFNLKYFVIWCTFICFIVFCHNVFCLLLLLLFLLQWHEIVMARLMMLFAFEIVILIVASRFQYRINGQYIIEGLCAGFMFSVGALGFILLELGRKVCILRQLVITFRILVLFSIARYSRCQQIC
jgi:hypothetical protein